MVEASKDPTTAPAAPPGDEVDPALLEVARSEGVEATSAATGEAEAEAAAAEPPAQVDPMQPGPEESLLPDEADNEGWIELLRDGFFRQLREENEWPEPPPLPRALRHTVENHETLSEGKFPYQALNTQLELLRKMRGPDGGSFGGCRSIPTIQPLAQGGNLATAAAAIATAAAQLGVPAHSAQALTGLLAQVSQRGTVAGVTPALLLALQRIAGVDPDSVPAANTTFGSNRKGKGRGGVQRTIAK